MNEEKDRFGDFIRLLERAREDVYFAAKDRDLIEKQHRRLEKARQSQLENPAMKCPRCGVKLRDSTLINFSVNRCPVCGGVWLDRAVLGQFLNMKRIGPDAERWSFKYSLRSIRRSHDHAHDSG
jgi:Zn-finger nucleic acid-binding protein